MTPLLQALYQFAMEHRINTILPQYQDEISENETMCAEALKHLSLSSDGADWFSRYRCGQDVLNAIHSEAAFRSGLGLGLELALLGQFPE